MVAVVEKAARTKGLSHPEVEQREEVVRLEVRLGKVRVRQGHGGKAAIKTLQALAGKVAAVKPAPKLMPRPRRSFD